MPLGSNRVHTLDIRVVAAAKPALIDAVASGAFRQDLFHRASTWCASASRRFASAGEDVRAAVRARSWPGPASGWAARPPLVDDAIRWRLLNHDWPGNVRELSHYAQRVALGLATAPTRRGRRRRPCPNASPPTRPT